MVFLLEEGCTIGSGPRPALDVAQAEARRRTEEWDRSDEHRKGDCMDLPIRPARGVGCTRRRFVWLLPAGAALLATAHGKPKPAPPPDPSTFPHLDERDPHSKAVGYVEDVARVDRKVYPKFTPGSTCGNCALYRVPAQPWSECTLFPRKLVAVQGWCDAYVRRAAP
jgi:hypothetical protein